MLPLSISEKWIEQSLPLSRSTHVHNWNIFSYLQGTSVTKGCRCLVFAHVGNRFDRLDEKGVGWEPPLACLISISFIAFIPCGKIYVYFHRGKGSVQACNIVRLYSVHCIVFYGNDGNSMDQITIKTPNPKCRLFLKNVMQRDLAAGVYLSADPSPPRFCLGW